MNTKYVKLTNKNKIHNNFIFKDGLNIDSIPISSNECVPGGIYFTTLDNIHLWLSYNGQEMYYIWDVTIPENSKVYHYTTNSKAESIILSNCRPINELVEWTRLDFCLRAVKQFGYVIKFIKDPCEEVRFAAVKQDAYAIQYIKDPSKEVQLVTVNQKGDAIQYIKNPSEEVHLAAVKQNGNAIMWIKDPSEEVQLAAVKQNGWAIEIIKDPSKEVQLVAVEQDGSAIQVIKNPSEEVQLVARHLSR